MKRGKREGGRRKKKVSFFPVSKGEKNSRPRRKKEKRGRGGGRKKKGPHPGSTRTTRVAAVSVSPSAPTPVVNSSTGGETPAFASWNRATMA